MKLPRWLVKSYLRISRFIFSFRSFGKLFVGCKVKYKDEVYTLTSFSYKSSFEYIHGFNNKHERIFTLASNVEFIPSFENFKNSGLYWFNWYMKCWYSIDVNRLSKLQELGSVEVLGELAAHNRR